MASIRKDSDHIQKVELLRKIESWCRDYKTSLDPSKPLLTVEDDEVEDFVMTMYVRATSSTSIEISVPYLLNPVIHTIQDNVQRDVWWQQILSRANGAMFRTDVLGSERWVTINATFHATTDDDHDEGRWFRVTGDIYEAYTWLDHDSEMAEELKLRFK